MLISGIPAFRLPRDILQKEIDALLDEGITLRCNTALGRDVTIDSLFDEGFKAIYLAMGAHRSRRMSVPNEDAQGVLAGMTFLKAFNLHGVELGKGHVGVIGGGNSAVDAARVAIRQRDVERVTIFYRRTRHEMPAYDEEIEAALEEGIRIETLITPVAIHAEDDSIVALEYIRNELGAIDTSGRRRPVPISGSETRIPLNTLIVAIGEEADTADVSSMGIHLNKNRTIIADPRTCYTSNPGVFAGGDVVTGPNTVVDAIATGRQSALMIDRYLRGEKSHPPVTAHLPRVLVEPPVEGDTTDTGGGTRVRPAHIAAKARKHNFTEVEQTLSVKDASREANRCLRCDLEFTRNTAESACREHECATGDAS
jgi:NADPH-dependent glutamate synthase beta subunit-like oxidoreductase